MDRKNRLLGMAAALLIALFIFCKDNPTPPPPDIYFTIKNESGLALEAVWWNGTSFGDIAHANHVQKTVNPGVGRISFVIAGKGINARTLRADIPTEEEGREFRFTVSTWVEEINDVNYHNAASLPSLRKSEPPQPGAVTAVEITKTSARLISSVKNAGHPEYTEKGLCYSKYLDDLEFMANCRRVEKSGDFTMTLDDLAPGTKYYAKSFVDNGVHKRQHGGLFDFSTQITKFTLMINRNPPVGGTTTPESGLSHDSGAVVTVKATPNTGYRFTGWTGAATSANATEMVHMDGDKALTANFQQTVTPPSTYTLSTIVSPADGGTILLEPEGASLVFADGTDKVSFYDIGGGKENRYIVYEYEAGTQVTVTATAAQGYAFTGWTGASTSTNAAVTITMDGDKALTANFRQVGTVDGGTLTYEGRDYRTVMIGGKRWMAENLNYAAVGSKCGGTDGYLKDENTVNCDKYGRLYTWEAAVSACPAGWHLPSDAEWTALENSVGGSSIAGTKLKSKTGWNTGSGYIDGTDDVGFSALPGGLGYGGDFSYAGNYGYWWSATEDDAGNAWDRYMGYFNENVFRDAYYKTTLFAVRCSQDFSVER